MSAPSVGSSAKATGPDRTAPPIEELIEQFAPIAAELERRSEEIIDRITTTIREEIPSYRTIPYGGLRDAVSVHVRRGLEASHGDAAPSPPDLAEATVIGREATQFGVPIEGQLQAMRVGVRIFWSECVQAATAHEVDPRALIALAEPIWKWADVVGLAFVRGHGEASVEDALHLERERSAFLGGLLQGSLAGPELMSGAEAHGLALDGEYLPLRARAFGAARPPSHCERTIRRALGPTAEDVMLCTLEGELIGVVRRRPVIDDPEVVIGLGSPAPLERIAPSYGEAVRALEVASRLGLRGTIDLGDLSLLAPVATETALGERLVARYLEPFRDGSHAGAELERTLRAYLEAGLRGESAARALHVHVNTLRNRLGRINALTGVELRHPSQLAELWWALQYDRIAGGRAGLTGAETDPRRDRQ